MVGLGRSAEAFAHLRSAREDLLEEGSGLAAATVLLDELALRLGELSEEETGQMLAELTALYSTEGLPRWARPPLIRLQRLGWRGTLTKEDVEEGRRALAAGPTGEAVDEGCSSERVH